MPIYEYACEKCHREFEVEQRITDDPIKTCPSCRSRKVKRLISRTSFVLKGGGWYSDLYASPGAKPADDKPGGDAKEAPSASGDGKTDKPEKSGKAEKPGKPEKSGKSGGKSGGKAQGKSGGSKAAA